MGRFYFGQILLAYVRDGKGHTKEHPVLVVGSDEEHRAARSRSS